MNIQISRESKTHLYLQIMNNIKNAIIRNEVLNGYKLPAERKLSDALGVHRNTIIKAYKLLVDEGYISVSQKPKGYFVSYGSNFELAKNQYNVSHFPPFEYIVKDEFLHINALFSRLFHTSIEKKIISFATAMPAVETYPIEKLNFILKDLISKEGAKIYGYSNPQGLISLRENISKRLEMSSIYASPSEITICSETYQAIDYLVKLVVSLGETILVEEPINPDIFDILTLLGTKVVTIPMDENGMIVDCLDNLILKFKPKFIMTIPTFHNPSMTTMSLERRHQLLQTSYRYNLPIIEINHDSSIRYEGKPFPSLKAMDPMGTVIYIDSFIFKLAPGVKLAYIVSSKNIAKKLSKMVEINQIFVDTLSQQLLSHYLEDGEYDNHIDEISAFYQSKRDLAVRCLREFCSAYLAFEVPKGGVSLWCKFKVKINQDVLLLTAEANGISFSPGHLFYPYGNEGDEHIRISYSSCSDHEIKEGIKILSDSIKSSMIKEG